MLLVEFVFKQEE